MNVLCSATPCSVILSTNCVFYYGANLVYTGIATNDNLTTILGKIDTAIGTLVTATGTVASVNAIGSTGISVTGGPITSSGTFVITNTAPDQTVILTEGTGIDVTGTYPSFTITNTLPDQTVVLTQGSGITITGTYPSFTISAAAGTGTVTSIGTTSPITGGTITTTGTIGITQSGAASDGYLSSGDWNIFNNKQPAGNYITALTGEATATGPGSVAITLTNSAVIGKVLTGLNVVGSAIVATDTILEAFGKTQNQINALVGGLNYQGVWNASTNTPTLTSSVGTKGYYYKVSVAGNTNLDGITDWEIGDLAIFNGTVWDQIDNTDSVSSVNGYTGAVSLSTDDVPEGVTNLYYTDARARAAISLTTTGSSGAATYNSTTGVFNVPNYTLSGLGGISGSGTIGYIPVFSGSTAISNSVMLTNGISVGFGMAPSGSSGYSIEASGIISTLSNINATGNIDAGGWAQGSSLRSVNVGGIVGIIQTTNLTTTDKTFELPNTSGTLALTSDLPDGTDFIQNQVASTQTAGFKISGDGTLANLTASTKVNVGSPSGTTGSVNTGQDGIYSYRSAGRYVRFNTSGTFNDFLSLGAKLVMNYGFSGTVENISMFEGSSAGDGQFIVGSPTATNARFLLKGKDTGSTNYISRWFDSGNTEKFSVRNDGQTTVASLSAGGIVKSTAGVLGIATAGTDYINGSGTTNYIPKFSGSGTLANSPMQSGTWTIGFGGAPGVNDNVNISIYAFGHIHTGSGVQATGAITSFDSMQSPYYSVRTSGFNGDIKGTNITATRTFELPNTSGTIALTSDIINYWQRTGTALSPTTSGDYLSLLTPSGGSAISISAGSGVANGMQITTTVSGAGMLINNSGTGEALAINASGATSSGLNMVLGSTGGYGLYLNAASSYTGPPISYIKNSVALFSVANSGALTGTSATFSGAVVAATGEINNFNGAAVYGLTVNSTSDTGTQYLIDFQRIGSQAGYIASTSSTTVGIYNTSDYRTKDDLRSFSGVELVKAMNFYDFKWKVGGTRDYGVIAHELQSVLPNSVIGEKDGKVNQAVDYVKLVPIYGKAIQEQQVQISDTDKTLQEALIRIEEQDEKIKTLENKLNILLAKL